MPRTIRRVFAWSLVAAAALLPSTALAQLVPVQQHRNVLTLLETERCAHGNFEKTNSSNGTEPFATRLVVHDRCPDGRAVAAAAQRSSIASNAIVAEGAAYNANSAGGTGLINTLNISTGTFDFQVPANTEVIISGTLSARSSDRIDLAEASLFFGFLHGSPTFVKQAHAEGNGERVTVRFEQHMTLDGGLYSLQIAARTIFADSEISAQRADAYFNIRVDVVN